jgi:amidophosphoribosyltransferase
MCGIFGIEGCDDAANLTYLGLYALQHRGQESTGIVSWDGTQLHLERGMGHVSDIFKEKVIARLPGRRALGHTRYSTAGSSVVANAQPIAVKTSMGPVSIVHNGNLVNPGKIRERLELEGSIFQTTSDTEVILHLMARKPRPDIVESFMAALEEVRGAYSLLLVTDTCLIAARDPNGFRPLVLGDLEGSPCFASETCAFDLLGARLVRELEPGEVVVARDGRVESYRLSQQGEPARCIFEHVYFARPDACSATRWRRRACAWAPAWPARRRRRRTSSCRCRTAASMPPWATAASPACRSNSASPATITSGGRSSSPSSRSGTSA